MAQPHPIELRQRLIEAYERGEGGYVRLARRFCVGEATAKRWVWRYHREGHVQPRTKGGGVRSDITSGHLLLFDLQYAKVDGVSPQEEIDPLPTDVMRYAAPDLAVDPGGSDVNSECYSICANLYFWLTGEPPIPGDGDIEVYTGVHDLAPVPPRKHRRAAGISPMLEEVVLRGLSKSRDERFQSFEELHSALTSVQWDLFSRRLGQTASVDRMPALAPELRATYMAAARLLVDNRRSSSLYNPMRVVEQLDRDAEPHLRRIVEIVDSFAARDTTALSAAERAALETIRQQTNL